jgi:hypothetical protein
METSFLNKSFDYTQELINKNPENEDNIIADYINFIIKVKNNNRPFVRSATYTDDNELTPENIRIKNNFQKYNSQDPIFIPTVPISNNPLLNTPATPPANPTTPTNPPATPANPPATPTNPPATPTNPPATPANPPAETFRNMERFKGYYR